MSNFKDCTIVNHFNTLVKGFKRLKLDLEADHGCFSVRRENTEVGLAFYETIVEVDAAFRLIDAINKK